MDVALRREVKALLADLWSGTDLEIALAKANLVVAFKQDEELTEADMSNAIGRFIDILMDDAKGSTKTVRESWDGDAFEAIAIEDLRGIIDQWYEGDSD